MTEFPNYPKHVLPESMSIFKQETHNNLENQDENQ